MVYGVAQGVGLPRGAFAWRRTSKRCALALRSPSFRATLSSAQAINCPGLRVVAVTKGQVHVTMACAYVVSSGARGCDVYVATTRVLVVGDVEHHLNVLMLLLRVDARSARRRSWLVVPMCVTL